MNHLRTGWRKLAWGGDEVHGRPLPTGGQFGQGHKTLDPDIFDCHERMHPWIRLTILAMLASEWEPKYGPDWPSWSRVYLAGSLASYWWGTPDVDVLIGIDSSAFIKGHSEFQGMTNEEICHHLTQEFYVGIDQYTLNFTFPPGEDIWQVVERSVPTVGARTSLWSQTRMRPEGSDLTAFLAGSEDSLIGDSGLATESPWSSTTSSTTSKRVNASSAEPGSHISSMGLRSSQPWPSIIVTRPIESEGFSVTAATWSSGDLGTLSRALRESWPTSEVTPLGPAEVTFYCNASSYDIRTIKPYAAYDVTRDLWAVHPVAATHRYGPRSFGWNFWDHMGAVADRIQDALAEPDPARRLDRAKAEYDRIHTERNQAFGAGGGGQWDPRGLQWTVMNRWGLLGALEAEIHPERAVAHPRPERA